MIRSAKDRHTLDGVAMQLWIVVVEPAHLEPAPGRSQNAPRDLAAELACAQYRDPADVVPAATQGTQRHANSATHHQVDEKPRDDPVDGPYARKLGAGLGQEQKREPRGRKQQPGVDQPLNLLEQRHPALRRIETDERKDGGTDKTYSDDRQRVTLDKLLPIVDIDPEGDRGDEGDEQRIEQAHCPLEELRVVPEQAAVHQGTSEQVPRGPDGSPAGDDDGALTGAPDRRASMNSRNSRRKRSAPNRRAFARHASGRRRGSF